MKFIFYLRLLAALTETWVSIEKINHRNATTNYSSILFVFLLARVSKEAKLFIELYQLKLTQVHCF